MRDPRHMMVTSVLLFLGTEIGTDDVPGKTVMTQPCHVVRIDVMPDAESA